MADQLVTGIVSIALAIISVAIIATLVSPQARTSQVLTASGNAFSTALGAALSPVVGGMGGLRVPTASGL